MEIARVETKLVRWSKVMVYAVLMLAAAATGVATYKFVKKGEIHDFNKAVSIRILFFESIISRSNKANSVFDFRLKIMRTTLFKYLRSKPKTSSAPFKGWPLQ